MSKLEAIFEKRRSIYHLGKKLPISEEELIIILQKAITFVPSSFNSQSSRIVLLLGEKHINLWNNITLNELKKITPKEVFLKTQQKINSFAKAYGTVLFFEDTQTIEKLEKDFPEYAQNFIVWANQTSAMLQYMVWTLFSEHDIGANLQHYNPIIDKAVEKEYNIKNNWKLIAQMPFGSIEEPAQTKTFNNIKEKLLIIK